MKTISNELIAANGGDKTPANLEAPEGQTFKNDKIENLPAPVALSSGGSVTLSSGLKFKVKKQVTRTVLRQEDFVPYAVTFQSIAVQGEVMEAGRGGKPKMEPARVADILNLETGELQIIIMNTVLEGELAREYGDDYAGRSFTFRRSPGPDRKDGRGYKVYEIAEIEIDGGEVIGGEIVSDASDPVNRKGNEPGKRAK
jgi:hypothetical protein